MLNGSQAKPSKSRPKKKSAPPIAKQKALASANKAKEDPNGRH